MQRHINKLKYFYNEIETKIKHAEKYQRVLLDKLDEKISTISTTTSFETTFHLEEEIIRKLSDFNYELETFVDLLDVESSAEVETGVLVDLRERLTPRTTPRPSPRSFAKIPPELIDVFDSNVPEREYAVRSPSSASTASSSRASRSSRSKKDKPACTLPSKLEHLAAQRAQQKVANVPSEVRLRPTEKVVRKYKGKELHEIADKKPPEVGMMCVFSYIVSPNEFYLHVADEETARFDELPEIIAKCVDSLVGYDTKEEASREMGKYCVLRQQDIWCRGEVLDWFLDKKTNNDVLVQLVDFGNTVSTSYKKIWRLEREAAEALPRLAVQCHLPMLYPPGSTHVDRLLKWPDSSIEAMKTHTESQQDAHKPPAEPSEEPATFKLVFCHPEGASISVDLYKEEACDECLTLGQILLDLGLAEQLTDNVDAANVEVERFVEDAETYGLCDSLGEALMGYEPTDEARTCRFARADGTCFKGAGCKLDHAPLHPTGFTTDKIPVFGAAAGELELPQAGATMLVLITSYLAPDRFYVQLIQHPVQHNGQYYMDSRMLSLHQLLNSKMSAGYEPFRLAPAVGEACLVLQWATWVRARVRSIDWAPDGAAASADVYLVDYGNVITVEMGRVRQMQAHLMELPFQAVECYLATHEAPRPGGNDSAAKAYWEEHLLFRNYFATVQCTPQPLKVVLVDNKGSEVGVAMAALGHLRPRRADFNMADSM